MEVLLLLGFYTFIMDTCVGEPFHCPPSFPCCKCKPNKFEVDCNKCSLIQVPNDLPHSARRLLLNINSIRNLTDSVFKGVPNLYHLEVYCNKIHFIGPLTFQYLPHLSYLDMSINPIWPKIIERYLLCQLPRKVIKILKFREMYKWKVMNKERFHCLQNTSLRVLDLSVNPAALNVTNGTFSNMMHLKSLTIQATKSKYFNVFAFENDTRLTKLVLNRNQIDTFPTFARLINGSFQAVLPNLKFLDLSDNKLRVLNKRFLHGLQKLQTLLLAGNNIEILEPGCIQPLTSLQALQLADNHLRGLRAESLNSSTLLYINMYGNKNLQIGIKQQAVFKNCPNIQTVNIDYTLVTYHAMELIFQNITTLRTLSMAQSVKVKHIPPNSFRGLHNLTKLHLESNTLRYIVRDDFSDLKSLKSLYLTSNRIKNINQTSLPNPVWHNLETLDFSDNPFHCDCDLFWFIDWIQSHRDVVININFTFCESPARMNILEAGINLDMCIQVPLSTGIKISWALSTVIVLFSVLYSAAVHYQWHVRTWLFRFGLYMNSSKTSNASQQETEEVEYIFDAFVCYNSEDRDWIRNVLLPELEERSEPPFRICEYERDWPSGHSLFDCIQQSIHCSHKVLLIVTNAFMQSEWCQFELLSVQQNLLHQDNDNIILAIMEDIEEQNMTPNLFLEMKRKTYLEWTDDEVGRKLFFSKLRQSLQKPNFSLFRAMPDPHLIHSY